MSKLKKVKISCQDCGSTGLYTGEATKDNTAIICPTCNGNGYIEAEYEPFTSRKKAKNIKKIFKSNFGCELYDSGEATYELENGEIIKINFDDYECTYNQWISGEKSPIILKQLSCPLIASGQDLEVVACMGCSENAILATPIGLWDCYKNRNKCWDKYSEKK